MIEVMAIVCIVAIMAAYAVNTYRDYSTRARLSEAAQLAHTVRQSIETHVSTKRTLPPNEVRSFLGQNMDVVEKMETVSTGPNSVRINIYIKPEVFPDEPEQQVFSLLGNIVGGEMSWDECGSDGCLTDASSLPPPVAVSPSRTSTGGGIQVATAPATGSPPFSPPAGPITPPFTPISPPASPPPSAPVTPPSGPIAPTPWPAPPPPIGSGPVSPPTVPPAPPASPPAPPSPTPGSGGSADGWIGGEIMIIKDSSIDSLPVEVHAARTDRSVVPDTMASGIHSRGYVGSVANGPISTIAIGPDSATTIFVYPKDDFTPTPGIIPCYKLTPGNTVVKGKTIQVPDPRLPTRRIVDCQVTAGAETPSKGGKPYVSPGNIAPDPSEPKKPAPGTRGPGWAGDFNICRETSGYIIEYTWETDSRLFGNIENKLFSYTICSGGPPNGYNIYSVNIRPQSGGHPNFTVHPALDFKPGERACYIVNASLKVVVADYVPRPSVAPCIPRK